MPITEKRLARFKEVVSHRQMNLTVVLENIHDPHNIAAVIRTCDAIGIREIYGIVTDDMIDIKNYRIGKRASAGARKWIDFKIFTSLEDAIVQIKTKYKTILGTHLSESAESLYDLNLADSVALMFGNEHDGLSADALKHLDGNFIIPQFGMVQSLNISVACAVSLYEACRQRIAQGSYSDSSLTTEKQALLDSYLAIHEEGYVRGRVDRK